MRPLRSLLVLAGLLTAAVAASAPRVPAVVPPPLVCAGEAYVTVIPDLPQGVDECELFLLPDDGSGRMIQLTPERGVDEGPLRWRMPRINATRARLVLRAGGRFGETESELSAPFAVAAPGPRERADVLRGDEELAWHFGESAAASDALRLPPRTTVLDDAARMAVAVEPTRDAGVEAPARAIGAPGRSAPVAVSAPAAPAMLRRPAFVPLRN